MKVHVIQWIMLAVAWLCGAIYVFGNALADADLAACLASYDYGIDWDTSPARPANWPVWRFVSTFLTASPALLLGGALAIVPLAIFLVFPRRQIDAKDWIVLVVSLLPLLALAVFYENGHDCDRKGNEYFFSWILLWPSQIVFILLGLIVSGILRLTARLGEQGRRP